MRHGVSRGLATWGRWVAGHRGPSALLAALVTALLLLGSARRVLEDGVPIDFTPQALFIDQGAEVDALEDVERVFGRDDNDLILLVEGPIGTEAGVGLLRDLHAAMEAGEAVERVDSLVNAALATGDGSGTITPTRPLDDLSPADAVTRLLQEPMVRRALLSEDGTVTALRVRIHRDLEKVADLGPVVHALTDRAEAVPRPPGFTVRPTGVPFVRTEVVDKMLEDELFFVPVVSGLFAVTICLLFRQLALGLVPLFAVLLADLWATAALIAGGAELTILSILVPTLVLVVGVADGIHMAFRYREELAVDGDRVGAMGRMMGALGVACLLNSFTTASGFASLLIAETRVVRDFGLHTSIAIMVCWLSIMLGVPLLLSLLPNAWVGRPASETHPRATALLATLERWIGARPRRVIAGCLAVTALAGWLARNVEADSHILEMYPEGSPTWLAIREADRSLGGVIPMQVQVKGAEGAVLEPEQLRRMQALQAAIEAEPPVRWAASLGGHVAALHLALTGEAGLPDSREAVAQELLLAELAEDPVSASLVNGERTRARVLFTLTDAGGREFLPMIARLRGTIRELYAGTGLEVTLTGDGLLAAVGVDTLIRDLTRSVGLVSVVVFLVMWALIGSARLALIAFVPNALPLLFTQATLGVMGEPLQTSNVVSFTVALGLAVDDTIHFLTHYTHERDQGHSVEEALRRTYVGSGHAMFMTSALLIVGFGVLTMSGLTSTRSFGLLAAVTMVAALFGDLLLLPALIRVLGDGRKAGAPGAPQSGAAAPGST